MIKELIHSPSEEEKQKHTPNIVKMEGNKVKVVCGRDIMHPALEAHYIAWLKLFGIDKEGKLIEIGTGVPATKTAEPSAVFDVELSKFTELQALIYCNLHGLWQNSMKL